MARKTKAEVIKALELCSLGDKRSENGYSCEECPYKDYAYHGSKYVGTNCDEEMMRDSLELLKDHEL